METSKKTCYIIPFYNLFKEYYRLSEEAFEKEDKKIIQKWIPERTIEFCCTQCGLNHEARDFIRAILLHLIDKLEKSDKFLGFLKDNSLLTNEAYQNAKDRMSGNNRK